MFPLAPVITIRVGIPDSNTRSARENSLKGQR
jgi:hypothetical protein